MLSEALYYSRMALGFAKWARVPMEPDPAGMVRRMVQERESNFLHLMRHAVFGHSESPYCSLFQWAGCAYGDLERLVHKDGLDSALESLLRSGVYLTHDEFKGKKPVERGGKQLLVKPGACANPLVVPTVETTSSGSRSKGTVTRSSLDWELYREAQNHVLLMEFDIPNRTHISLAPTLPALGGFRRVVNHTRRGYPVEKWFAFGDFKTWGHYRSVTRFLIGELRLLGVPATDPTYLPRNDFSEPARWIARRKNEGAACVVTGGVSRGVRVASAAAELGLDISGTVFLLGGETLTPAKCSVVEAAGCDLHAVYTISELGRVGAGCRHMKGNSAHICLDSLGVISRRKFAPLTEVEVNSLMFTALQPSAPHVLVNVEMDDAANIGNANCDCSLTRVGFTKKIEQIYSYGKLTGQGTSLMGGEILHILESRLPARFGGSPTDYQLVECEGAGQTDIELRVNPRLNLASTEAVKDYFLSEIKRLWTGSMTRTYWISSGGVRVVFAEPYVGRTGKVQALHLLGPGTAVADAERS